MLRWMRDFTVLFSIASHVRIIEMTIFPRKLYWARSFENLTIVFAFSVVTTFHAFSSGIESKQVRGCLSVLIVIIHTFISLSTRQFRSQLRFSRSFSSRAASPLGVRRLNCLISCLVLGLTAFTGFLLPRLLPSHS